MPVKGELIKTSLRGTVTESAANTFTEQLVDTNLAIRGDHVFIVTGVWFHMNANLNGAGDALEVQVCYAPQTDIVTPADPDWFIGADYIIQVITSGGGQYPRIFRQAIDHFPIAVGALYLGVKGTSLAAAGTASVKIEGYHAKVNTQEFFRLAQSR